MSLGDTSKGAGHNRWGFATMVIVSGLLATPATAEFIFEFNDPGGSGLAAEAEFTLVNPTTLIVRLRNTSTGVPFGFDNSDQILTAISWDFGAPGFNGDPMIISGTVAIGPTSQSLNFDTGSYGPGTDVSGEWGYGNMDGTGLLANFISASRPESTPFGGANLDGAVNIDGPQGGLVADPLLVPLGGLGAIQDEIIATLTLDEAIFDLNFLILNGVLVEFGSDAAFLPGVKIPAPGVLALLSVGGLLGLGRRRRTA